jgi:hypothetical protein
MLARMRVHKRVHKHAMYLFANPYGTADQHERNHELQVDAVLLVSSRRIVTASHQHDDSPDS